MRYSKQENDVFFIKVVTKSFIFFIFITLLYLFVAFVLAIFPKNGTVINSDINTATIYILYNEMHSDIVLEINSSNQELQKRLSPLIKSSNGYLAFGWGDKETYLNTPTWDKIQISTTFKALFLNTPSVMHVSYYPYIKRFQKIKKVKMSLTQFNNLQESIFQSFDFTKKSDKGYGYNDLFYTSNYKYNLFNTCNTWTGNQLRDSNITMSYWTPLSQNVIDSLP